MKKFLSIILLALSLFSHAQLDTDHWFAPMVARAGISNAEGYLYLSTNETVPFSVNIYNNNVIFSTVQVSKGNPQQVAIPIQYMMTTDDAQLYTANTMGLFVKGTKKFYANYRFGVTNHAEIITSKGLAGIGKTFFVGMAANTASQTYINSMMSVIATEDNTTVTISGYNPAVVFSNGTSSATKTFTLNRGKSYILDAVSTDSNVNLAGLIGAKIVADKPISVTNGNFNAIYTNNNFSNNDILMDQSVPIERLGTDFAVVKGNGVITSGMEQTLVIATENNTQLTVNGNNYGSPMNAGNYVLIPGGSYIDQGGGYYNLGIKSNKNIYVYQLLGGTSTSNIYATGGFNYIPPLSCFLPNKVDEIGFINTIGATSFATKLNILTQTGAVVTVNGANIAAGNGPYPINGNPNWVTYSIPSVTGNITVNSTKSVTAGIAAGSGAVGYGGYFAGFSSVPVIVKTGDCYAGILLQVDNSYDSYQWYLNGAILPGETNFSINPELYGAGNYTCLITKLNCESKLTDPYAYTVCPPISTTTLEMGSCKTLSISPVFTNSTQSIAPNKTIIVANGTSGTATVNSTTGVISYTPNAGLTADVQDQFVYYIEGNGNPADFEFFKVKVNIDVLQVNNASLSSCANATGNGNFNLTSASVSPDLGATFQFYSDAAQTIPIPIPTNYNAPAGNAYVKITSSFGCTKIAQIALTVLPIAILTPTNYNPTNCDDNLDGIINIDFSMITPQILTNAVNFTVKYYLVQADATAGNANTLPNNWSYTTNTTVYIRVESANGCPPVFGQMDFALGAKIPLATTDYSSIVCDFNNDGTESVDLNNYKNNFTLDPNVILSFYSSLNNAQNNIGAINAIQNIAPNGVFYIRFQSPNACPVVAKLSLSLDAVIANNATLTSCSDVNGNGTFNLTSANVTTTPGATISYFSNSTLTNPILMPANYNSVPSVIYILVTSTLGCTKTAQITLNVNPLPNINTNNFNAALCDDNFDGIINVNFSIVTPQIVNNSGAFTVRYYLVQADANAGNGNNLPNNWTYTTNTTVYVRVDTTGNCPAAFGQINFSIGNKIVLLTQNANAGVCDSDISGTENVNLNDYKNIFTADPNVTLTFHTTLANAQNGTNAIPANQVVSLANTVFFIRFVSATGCPNTAQITINKSTPKKSDILVDKTICPGTTTILDAGLGFTSYLWNTGANTPSIVAPIGDYYVDLGSNGCIYRQFVKVKASISPTITSITVVGSTATINVTGGNPPYQYSLDGITYQTSNIFPNLIRGLHKAYVISADLCDPVVKEFLVLNIVNAFTPNGDGINDVLDYSDLRVKKDVSIEIIDRYGSVVYKSANKNYIWDGKLDGRPLPTGTYWYNLKWIEPDTNLPSNFSGWILIKNRN